MPQLIRICFCLVLLHCAVTSGNASSSSDEINAADYLSSVAVAITPNSTDRLIDFSFSGSGEEIASSAWSGSGENQKKIIRIFDDSLKLIRDFEVTFEHASAVVYGSIDDDLLYTAGYYDYNSVADSMVYVYNTDGEYVSEFKTNGTFFALGMAGSEGLLYLTYWGINKVLIYNEDGTYEGSIEQGLDGQPIYVTVTEDKIYVNSRESIHIYDKNYNFIHKLPYNQPPFNFSQTIAGKFAVDESGNLLVPDYYDQRVVVVDADYERVGTIDASGTGLGEFPGLINAVSFAPDSNYFLTSERLKGLMKFEFILIK